MSKRKERRMPARSRREDLLASTSSLRKLPPWLPSPVAEYIQAIMAGHVRFARPDLRLTRLVTDPRMESTWRSIESELQSLVGSRVAAGAAPPDEIIALRLRSYLLSAINADNSAAYLAAAPSASQQRSDLLRIGSLARELIGLLGDPLQFYKFSAWDCLDSAAHLIDGAPVSVQELLRAQAKETYGRFWKSNTPPKSEHFVLPLSARALLGDFIRQLGVVAVFSDLAVGAEGKDRSKPLNKTKHLIRTVYVRELARLANSIGLHARQPGHRQAGFSLHRIIAVTANVAMDLVGSDELRPDLVRKLIEQAC